MISEECKNRIVNWKFAQARSKLTGDETVVEKDVIGALADMLGDPGWSIDGSLGVLVDTLVVQMVDSVLYNDEDDEDEEDAQD